ncbi:MAG: lytic transglycosylase domain-containing protein [Nitrospirae bacterium]|nr:lytic transglycosylase domain-containing protein [Nitrospirota bacterium]
MARGIITGLFIFMLSAATSAYCDIYKYVDKNGVAYYTNIPRTKDYKKIYSDKGGETEIVVPERTVFSRGSYTDIIRRKSSDYGIEPSLVHAIITVESNWRADAVSPKGAMGLMQLMPLTASDMDVINPYDPEENIEGGVRYLRLMLDKFNDLPLALAAYNAGPRTVEEYGGIPDIPETRQYVKKVLAIYNGTGSSRSRQNVYKVTLKNGTVLFTNNPTEYKKSNVTKF